MKTLIVDDFKINRSLLHTLIKDNFPKLVHIDEAESVKDSCQLLEKTNYDLIFLDIELKDGLGFDVLNAISTSAFVIVISSHKDYAIDAIRHNVVDYLVRPINVLEFKRAVKKVIHLYEQKEIQNKLAKANNLLADKNVVEESLFVNYKNGYVAISKNTIQYIKAQGKCSEIFVTDGNRYTSYKNLKEFEHVLPLSFVRVHHSCLVNIQYISYFSRETSLLKLTSGKELPVSTRKKEELFKKFNVF